MTTWKNWLAGGLFLAVFGFLAAAASGAFAADKAVGGDCCADLEERIAVLEATTARKGNRKVKLTISGQVSEALLYITADGGHQTEVISNPNRAAQSYVRFEGEALVSPGWKLGFTADVGIGGFENGIVAPMNNGMDTNGIYVRQEFLYVKSDGLGELSVGKQTLSTYGITGYTGGNTGVAHTKLSLAPLIGPPAGAALDLWDGGITNAVKYSSPHFMASKGPDAQDGVWVEAAWANADDFSSGGGTNGNLWDVAIKAMHNFGEFQVGGGVGYRDGLTVDLSGTNLSGFGFSGLNVQDVKVFAGSAYVKHMATGLFANGSYGSTDISAFCVGCHDLKAWEVQAGDDLHLNKLGTTTVFAGYAQYDLSGVGLGDANKGYSVGVVQSVDAAAADLYVSWQRFDFGSGMAIDAYLAGARVRF